MLRVTVLERGRLERAEELDANAPTATGNPARLRIPAHLYDRLLAGEGAREDRGEKPVFTWSRRHAMIGPWVGVIQVPGLQVEILPKTDEREVGEAVVKGVRRNLLHMLAWGGLARVRDRGVAELAQRTGMLHDQLVARFLEHLGEELRRGADRCYEAEEGNLLTLRGKLVLSRHLPRNAAQKHRFYCRYDEINEFTAINSVLHAACLALRHWSLPNEVQRSLTEPLALLADVTPAADPKALPSVSFNRQNERFQDLYEFARMVLTGMAPDVRSGEVRCFTLLFDMDKVFERFVAAFIGRYVVPRIHGLRLYPQGEGNRRYLYVPDDSDKGRRALLLTPDMLFSLDQPGQPHRLFIIDTKWKQLDKAMGARPANGDLYQLYAYLLRYGCERAFLLYPAADGLEPEDYEARANEEQDPVAGHPIGTVGARFVDLRVDLATQAGRDTLAVQLESIVREGLGWTYSMENESVGGLTA